MDADWEIVETGDPGVPSFIMDMKTLDTICNFPGEESPELLRYRAILIRNAPFMLNLVSLLAELLQKDRSPADESDYNEILLALAETTKLLKELEPDGSS